MWRFSAWDELRKASRVSYVSNARLALSGDVGYVEDPKNKDAVQQHLLYNGELDKVYTEREKGLVENAEDDLDVREPRKSTFTRHPIRIVDFMLAVNMNPWFVVEQTCSQSESTANGRASALASVCYTFLRLLYKQKKYNTPLFRKVLDWSHIFERYTRVAKRITGDRHASQQTTPEKLANTVDWPDWMKAARTFIERYFVIKGLNVEVRTKATPARDGGSFRPWWPGHPTTARGRKVVLDDVSQDVEVKPKTLLPWWRPEYAETEAQRERPNIRELRDAAMVAVYSMLAPIRLDWATVQIMDESMYKAFGLEMKAAEEEKIRAATAPAEPEEEDDGKAKPKKRAKKFNVNILVVDNLNAPTKAEFAYFGQMKNISSFKVKPVPKKVREESPLCEQILLAYLRERQRVGFDKNLRKGQHSCLFPYSAYMATDFSKDTVDEKAAARCFSNSAFGERLADLAYDLTGKNFTETLFRRSYITWFWQQPSNSPLNTLTWERLLPSVHQNSKDASLGYIKGANTEYQEWLSTNRNAAPATKEAKQKELFTRVLTHEGHNVEAGQDPEVDPDDRKENKTIIDLIMVAKKEEQVKIDALRRSNRLAKNTEPAAVIAEEPAAPPENVVVQTKVVKKTKKTKAIKPQPQPPPQPPPQPAPLLPRRSGRTKYNFNTNP